MALHLLMRITFLLLLTYELAEAAAPIAKSNCKSSCGNVKIPFPFGIGPNCYMDKWFEVVCIGTGSSAKAFLTRIEKEVLQIDIMNKFPRSNHTYGPTLKVQMPTIYTKNCNSTGYMSPVNITGSPFNFSAYFNTFISVGCDNFAAINGNPPSVFGCKSNCTTVNQSLSSNSCETRSVPYGLQTFNVEFRSLEDKEPIREKCNVPKKEREKCKYAFLVDRFWLQKSKPHPTSVKHSDHVPVVLDWAIYNWTAYSTQLFDSLKHKREVECNFYDEDGSYFFDCARGYEGNPYLNGSCEDIDECEDWNLNKCVNKLDCENTEGGYNCNKRKSRLKMLLIGLGTSVGVLFLLTITWVLYKVIKKRNEIKLKKRFFKKNGGLLLQQQLLSTGNNVQNAKLFKSNELEKATDHFNQNRIVGKGGQGTVYKGMLSDGRITAVKKCNTVQEGNLEHFINEIFILSQINHRNVVKLIGCCLEIEVPLLVYEFIPNGTLFQYLHEENEEFPLTWDRRLRIATEIAEAIFYLHSASSSPIYHRDIKSTNILLDEKYRAKIADFGTSKSVTIDQTHVTTLISGTFGYLDPEYFQTSQFTEKSDVYSFGVVLIELLTGEKPVSSTRSGEGKSLSAYFILSMKENRLFDILDDRVKTEGDKEEVNIVANLAKKCLHLNGKKRPTMREIAIELQGIRKTFDGQQHCEELEYVRSKEIEPADASFTSTQSSLQLTSSSSSTVLPLMSFKKSLKLA